MDLSSYKTWERIILIATAIGALIYFYSPTKDSTNDTKSYYSYYDAAGNKVIINLNEDESGTIRMEYAPTSSGLEQYLSKEPIPCSWFYYSSSEYLQIYSREGDIYIKDGYAYFSYQDMKSKDSTRRCKLN